MDRQKEKLVLVEREKFSIHRLLKRPVSVTEKIEDGSLISSQNGDVNILVRTGRVDQKQVKRPTAAEAPDDRQRREQCSSPFNGRINRHRSDFLLGPPCVEKTVPLVRNPSNRLA